MKSLVSIVFIITVICSGSKGSDKYTILKNCNIIPIQIDTILYKKNVVILNDRIIAIENDIERKYRNEHTKIIDCSGKFVIPGLFDSHFHYGRNQSLFKTSDSLLLTYGVTNVFALNGSTELLAHREKIENKTLIGPKIICTGRIQNDSNLSKQEALKRLKEHKEKGYEFIKIYTHLSKEGFYAYSENAHNYGLRLVGHIPREIGFFKLMETNQELICHAEEILYNEPVNYLMGPDEMNEPDYSLTDTIATTLKKHDKWISPTLVAFQSILLQSKAQNLTFEGNASENKIAEYWNWLPPKNKIPSKFDTNGKRFRLEKGFIFQKKLVKSLYKHNVKLLAGTDAPAYWNLIPGKSLHEELMLIESCGVPAYEVLKTATLNPAHFLHLNNDYGTVEVSKKANLVILTKNPLENVKNIRDIFMVILNGQEL